AAVDRREKLRAYQSIPSLMDYCLVAQDECRIEKYGRNSDEKTWTLTIYGHGDVVDFACLATPIDISAFYEGIRLN
ncbi:MAG: Uma2 family endonuclease, partial [Gammaproteobacteria bacterium]